jgi:hypothetical protein
VVKVLFRYKWGAASILLVLAWDLILFVKIVMA